jgi:pimeloyl-ACP methyl ester carboxylesterase
MAESGITKKGVWPTVKILISSAALLVCYASCAFAQNVGVLHSVRSLELHKTKYRMRPGETVAFDAPRETLDFVRAAKKRATTTARKEKSGFIIGPSVKSDQVLLAASLTMTPGDYTVSISAVSETGEGRSASINVTLDPLQTVPTNATSPPVVLLNGWQFGVNFNSLNVGSCPPSSGSSDTFGSLAQLLQLSPDNAPAVYFFDNCVEYQNGRIEDLGAVLGQVLDLIRYDDGTLVPQVDLIAHSMGGLIARAYLSGLQVDGSFSPPTRPRIRKLVEIGTPNFGSFKALNLGAQTAEMIPGSLFLLGLSRGYTQLGDDLRGVDALAIIGNRGNLGNLPRASDGVVTLLSGSLQFARDSSRTRILNYCHVNSSFVANPLLGTMDCIGNGIANVDEAPETAAIVTSFLANSSEWQSICCTASQDPYLSLYNARITNPLNGSSLSSSSVTFAWNAVAGAQEYVLYIGNTAGGNDIASLSGGTKLSATVSGVPTDGRTIHVRIFTHVGDVWIPTDYSYQAANVTPKPSVSVTLNFTNKLVYAVNISANGTFLGTVSASGTTSKTISIASNLSVSFSLVRPTLAGTPLGDPISGVFDTIQNPSGTYNFPISNRVGGQSYFAPFVTNHTSAGVLMDVNAGLTAENKCFCVAPAAASNVAFGYYRLYTNSNVRAYPDGSNYSGRYQFWGNDAVVTPNGSFTSYVESDTGILRLTLDTAP